MCTCGNPEPHEIARRRSADGKIVLLWSDGAITGALGLAIPKLSHKAPAALAQSTALAAGHLALDEVGFYDLADAARLVKTARRALEQTMLQPREFLRRSMAGETFRRHGKVVVSSPPAAPPTLRVLFWGAERQPPCKSRYDLMCRRGSDMVAVEGERFLTPKEG